MFETIKLWIKWEVFSNLFFWLVYLSKNFTKFQEYSSQNDSRYSYVSS